MGEFELEFVCPNPACNTILVPKAKDLGKSTTCPVCMAEFIVPSEEGDVPKIISLPEPPKDRHLATIAQVAELKEMGIRHEPDITSDKANELMENARILTPYIRDVSIAAFGWNVEPVAMQRILNTIFVQSSALPDILVAAKEAWDGKLTPKQIPTNRKGYTFVKFTIRKARIATVGPKR